MPEPSVTAELAAACGTARCLARDGDLDLSLREPAVSAWSIGQHLEHAARALRGCLAAAHRIRMGKGQVVDGGTGPSARAVLDEGRIPRGLGEAPERTLPAPDPDRDTIERLFAAVSAQIDEFAACREPASGFILHHDLGSMSAAEWLGFGAIHTRHHLEIVEQILDGPSARARVDPGPPGLGGGP